MKKLIQASYRKFQSVVVKKCVLPLFFSKERQFDLSKVEANSVESSPLGRIWFHAASVGELESLWSLIELFAEHRYELILTVLSESAKGSLEKLKQTLSSKQAVIAYYGFSPWEGEWGDALKLLRPSLFVTAKYEAWPDLWMSLKEQNIPLAIIAARARKSLKIADRICRMLVGGPPSLYLFPCLESDASDLRSLFPKALVQVVGEPRWDRVMARSQVGNARAKEVIQTYQELKRPWAVIGSAWMDDLKFLQPIFEKFSGTLWVVPHKVDSDNINQVELFLNSHGFHPLKSSQSQSSIDSNIDSKQKPCVLVDEMGFLSEIYPVADWAFVGGGWGAGIHSTIEPAIHGIPIGVGPRGTAKFSEVTELRHSGQLSILTRSSELLVWYLAFDGQSQKKAIWAEDAQKRLGAAQRIFSYLAKTAKI